MRHNIYYFLTVVIGTLLVVDLYAYKGIRLTVPQSYRSLFKYLYWAYSIFVYLGLILIFSSAPSESLKTRGYAFFYTVIGMAILSLVPKIIFIVFHLIEDLGFLSYKGVKTIQGGAEKITRFTFLTKLGLFIAAIPFFSIIYGIIWGKYNYKVKKNKLAFKNLPKGFDGLTVVQFSDAHLGSFDGDTEKVKHAFEMINDLQADLIFFTGDLVNNFASEAKGWDELFTSLNAKIGKFSILGNHDYSDYMHWDSEIEKKQNLDDLKAFHAKTGFQLLLNQNIEIMKGLDSIRIIGVENWGKGGFAKYGDLEKALEGTNPKEFQLLLSHDPSHWDEKVLKESNIDLTFAGHTHGMQFGINLGRLKYSPVQHRYPRWMGLYKEQDQYLHVNPGFGFLGFPGRVGITPEISYFEFAVKSV